jgi:N-acetylmuramoyl-L-alanine amidase
MVALKLLLVPSCRAGVLPGNSAQTGSNPGNECELLNFCSFLLALLSRNIYNLTIYLNILNLTKKQFQKIRTNRMGVKKNQGNFIMSALYTHCSKKRLLVVIFLAFALVCTATTGAISEPLSVDSAKKIIVLDPGHGGHDNGAKGPEGTFEKNVTLTLARGIMIELGNRYKVSLTRTDDYWLDIPSRTATANHLEADLFISIHSGGSFLHQASGISLYYFKDISVPALTFESDISKPMKSINNQIPWDNIQIRHKTTSKALAKMIQNQINTQTIFIKSEVEGAPLMVLKGADMPAILLEAGYITNPAQEKALLDSSVLSNIAQAVAMGIDDFFKTVH